MRRGALLALPLLAACPRTGTDVAPTRPASCRTSDASKTCIRVPDTLSGPELGGPQGVYLEGEGIERLHFTAMDARERGRFPPAPGTKLTATAVCNDQQHPVITVRRCDPVPGIATAGAVFTCQVDVENKPGICLTRTPLAQSIRDPHPMHHRGVTIVRGFWDATGAWQDDPSVVSLSCDAQNNAPDVEQFKEADGAITKCVRTWRLDPQGYSEGFLACIRMVRADYCGDGRPNTFAATEVRATTPRLAAVNDPYCSDSNCFEATWSRDGVVCISRPRWEGPGMGYEHCQGQFTPVGNLYCRTDPSRGVVSSRSEQNVCGQPPRTCGPEIDPKCGLLDPGGVSPGLNP